MIQGYFDGSGTHVGSKVLVIAGFIGEEEAFVDLDQQWEKVLNDPRWPTRLPEFHTVECVHGGGEFQQGGWNYAERLALYGDLTRVIVEVGERHILLPIGAGAVTGIFNKIATADLDLLTAEGLGTPFDLTFQLLLQQIIHRTNARDFGSGLGRPLCASSSIPGSATNSPFNRADPGVPPYARDFGSGLGRPLCASSSIPGSATNDHPLRPAESAGFVLLDGLA